MTPNEHMLNLTAIYNDLILTAAATVERMHEEGFIDAHGVAGVTGQLNATLYTLAFKLPPGAIKVQNVDTNLISEVKRVRATKTETQTKGQ